MEMQNIFDHLLEGKTIRPDDPEAYKLRESAYLTIKKVNQLNASSDPQQITQLLGDIIGVDVDESVTIFPPVHINYGPNLKLGNNVFINFNCTFLTLGGISIGNNVLIGPGVTMSSESHPLNPGERHSLVPGRIVVSDNVWIGAGALILQGITIGKNSVVAAGAIVTKDVPPNTVVAGVPAREVRKIEP
ncbi:MAG: sugar O-acetyltransferase [Chitinophagaceae bacterium]|nr:MAG: sugar O-acetyltransferase [Chitinophagaceae bacterium]